MNLDKLQSAGVQLPIYPDFLDRSNKVAASYYLIVCVPLSPVECLLKEDP